MKVQYNTLKKGDIIRGYPGVLNNICVYRSYGNNILLYASSDTNHQDSVGKRIQYGPYNENSEIELFGNIKKCTKILKKMLLSQDIDSVTYALDILKLK